MNQQVFTTEPGQQITIDEVMKRQPDNWNGDIKVVGVQCREGKVYESNTPDFYSVYWVLEDGFEFWIEDFVQFAVAGQFADLLRSNKVATVH